MRVARLQRIDRWLGGPLCFLLTLLRRFFPNSRLGPAAPVGNLLFVKLAEQGSTVLAYPAIRQAIELVGRANVYFVVFEDNRFILDVMEVIPKENVFTISFASFPAMLRTTFRALHQIRKAKLDAAIDLEFFTRGSAILTFLSGARRRVGFHSFFGSAPYRGNLMTHRLLYNPHLHTSHTFVAMVEALQKDPASLPAMELLPRSSGEEPPRFCPRPDEIEVVRTMLPQEFHSDHRLIILNPNASDLLPLRRWPAERYLELGRKLLAQYSDLMIAFTGSPKEAAVVESLARRTGSERCFSLAGKTTLRQLLVLFTLADVLVTNDSGPAHFAALTPIRVVTLFGPETPALYSSKSSRNVPLWAGLVCSPCVNAYNNRQSPCRNNVCMQAITVDQVFAEVCRAYDQGSAARKARTQARPILA